MTTLIILLALVGLGTVVVGAFYGVRRAGDWLIDVIDERAYDAARRFKADERDDDRRMTIYLINRAIREHEEKGVKTDA